MARILITAQVEDATEWEKGFRTHGGLFKDQTVTTIDFTATEDNEVGILFEADNLDTYMGLLESPATEEAMKNDGVKRDTVKIFVLDKTINP